MPFLVYVDIGNIRSSGERKGGVTTAPSPSFLGAGGVQGRVEAWIAAALTHARMEPITDPAGFIAEVPAACGAWGFGETPDEAIVDLQAGLEGWLKLKVEDGDDDIPAMGGISFDP